MNFGKKNDQYMAHLFYIRHIWENKKAKDTKKKN